MTTKFQFQSDIHLEVGNQYSTYKITPTAPYLILAGDIGNLTQYEAYVSFLSEQCQNFQKVFLVLGNHEFYNVTRSQGVQLAQQMTQEEGCRDKLVLLHRTRFDIDTDTDTDPRDNVTILGCTLNSLIRPQNALMTRMKVHDFAKIHEWTVEAHNAEHDTDLSWLKAQMEELEHSGRKVLVVTHHAPFRRGCAKPQYEDHEWHDAFATALLETDTPGAANVLCRADTWVFGHTHYSTECDVRGVKCIANQRGYVFPWQVEGAGGESAETTATNAKKDEGAVKSGGLTKLNGVFKNLIPGKRQKKSSFKVIYPGPLKGHEGDGSVPFDPLRCVEM